ncbi:MAG: hypothetical protein JNK46_19570 [Methylobacteriaceae bacterium]|nr:hypothetical protein [Methylobacteriaceae bacterium]
MDDWLSLDEAPKDGRMLLVKFASGAICPGCWSPELQSWAFDLADVPADIRHWTSHPVAWRPLDGASSTRDR